MNLAGLAAKYPFLQNNIRFWESYIKARDAVFGLLPSIIDTAALEGSEFKQAVAKGRSFLASEIVPISHQDLLQLTEAFAREMGLAPVADLAEWRYVPPLEELEAEGPEEAFLVLEVHAAICAYIESVLYPDEEITGWMEPYCPICGSGAAMGLIDPAGKKNLVCSHCHTSWRFLRSVCGICSFSAERGATYASADELPDWRMEMCDSCKGYLKVYDMRNALPEIPVYPLLYLTTWELDLSLKDRGYRPSLFHVYERANWLGSKNH